MAKPPNILVFMCDQLRPDALGCYGHPGALTPHFDALAARGVVFDNAYTNSPLCTPARVCLMTGQLPSTSGGYDNAAYLASTVPTFAHLARDAGYRTVLSGKMHFIGPDQLHGFEERRITDIYPADFGWTPDWDRPGERIDWWYHNMDSVRHAGVAETSNQLRYDDETGFHALRALQELAPRSDGRPFLLVASFTHPHDPYVTRREYWQRYEGREIPMPAVARGAVADDPHSARLRAAIQADLEPQVSDAQVRAARRAYLGNVSYCDDWLGRCLASLEALQCADDTIVIALADHGDMLGERGLWYKMNFFEGSARVPLIVHAPGRFAARRVAAPVSLVDILPTLAELAGASTSACSDLAGESLLPLCGGANRDARSVRGEYLAEGSVAPIVMLREGRWKYIHCEADPDQLYDLVADPEERVNRAADPAAAPVLARLRAERDRHWDLPALEQRVRADQRRRHFIQASLRKGRHTAWEYTPPQDGGNEYMRNHLDLNEVERKARWPR